MPYYGPDEPYETIVLERYFLAGDCISGLGFGIQAVLFFTCALYLWKERVKGRFSLFLLAYITLLFVIEIIFIGVQANTVQLIYIDNRNYPGGPWQFFLDTQQLAVNVMFYATLFVLTFLSDLLVLWRCWVIWTASGRTIAYLVTSIPAIIVLGSFVMGTLWTLQSSQPGLSMYSSLPMAFGTAYYAISLSANIILTLLIMLRLWMYRRRLVKAQLGLEHAKHYVSLGTVIVESAALYSVFALIFLITYATGHPVNQIFLTTASSAQQIAGYLIIYRVAEGRAWNKDTNVEKMSTMHFTVNGRGGTDTRLSDFRASTPTHLELGQEGKTRFDPIDTPTSNGSGIDSV